MNRRRRIRKHSARIVAATAALALALAACGRDDDDGGGGGGGGDAEPTTEGISEGPATGTIEVWAMGTEGEALGEFATAFQDENPDAEVKVTPVPWDAAHERIATAIAANQTPDVSLIGTTWMGEFGAGGGLDPTPEGVVDDGAFFPAAWESTVVDGVSYGVPWYVDTRVLFYRTDLAQQAGITEAPQNWQELKEMAEAFQQNGAKWGMQLGDTWDAFLPWAWQNGAEIYDGESYTLDTPEMTEALEFFNSFYTEGLVPKDALEPGALESGFVDGSIPMFISGPWHLGLINEQGGEGFADKYTVAPLPEGTQSGAFAGGGNLGVFADSDNRDSAWKFVQWLTDPGTQQDFYAAVTDLPSVQEAWESGDLADDPKLSVFGDQLQIASAPPAVPRWEELSEQITSEVQEVIRGGKDPAEAAAAMQSKADQIGTGL